MAIEPSFKQEEIQEREKVKNKSMKKSLPETIRFDWPSPAAAADFSSINSSPKMKSSQGESESEEISDSSSSSGSIGSSKYSDVRSRSESKKTLIKTRSRKFTSLGSFRSSRRRAKSRFDQTNDGQNANSIEVSDASPSHYSQTSSRNSESSFGSCENGNEKKFSRTSSLRSKRVLKKNTSLKLKKPLKAKRFEVSLDPSLGKATYSSILKDSKFPKVEDEPEKHEVLKVCPYHHCSLHGHHHHDLPDRDPPKRFEYLKRRSVKSQEIERSQLKSAVKKKSGVRREEGRGSKGLSNVGNGEDFSIEFYAKTRCEPVLGAIQEHEDAVLADILFGVRSFQGNLNENRDVFAEGIDIREGTSSEAAYKDFGASSIKGDDMMSTIKEKTANLNEESREEEKATSSASNLLSSDICSPTIEERSREIKLDGHFEANMSEASSAGHEVNSSRVKKVNRLSMWHMIHKQMVSGLASETGNGLLNELDEDKQVGINDPNKLPEKKDFGSQTDFSDSDMGTENQDPASQEIEIRKMFAIKMVREAIEKILLPEVQDDQSVTSEVTSEHDLSEKNQGQGGEEPRKDEEKAAGTEGKKSESKAPKRWSYLKKVILLNKFIKEIEKVKKLTPKKPRVHLPMEPEQESEKVSLRRGLMGEKKNSEEWMVDFALRQVVSELAPMQKKKVALLVKAFETVAPSSQDEEQIKVAIPKLRNSIPKSSSQPQNSNADLNSSISEFTAVGIQTEAAVHVSSSKCESPEQITVAGEEKNEESKHEDYISRDISSSLGSKLDSTAKGTEGEELDRTKRLKMWHMIYQHVVTNIAEKVGTQLLLDEEYEEEEKDNEKKKFPESVKDSEDHDARSNELSRSEAVKLVQEAVDEILVPEDSSDTQSVASDNSLTQEEERESGPTLKNKLDPQKSKNWSKLKKLILLKRSIRALEQDRKVNLRRPHQELPLVNDRENEEKVDLKSRMTDERKKAEEWMLDYAVRHIVTTLTPARKRRVAMLVEAFEAVVPLPQV